MCSSDLQLQLCQLAGSLAFTSDCHRPIKISASSAPPSFFRLLSFELSIFSLASSLASLAALAYFAALLSIFAEVFPIKQACRAEGSGSIKSLVTSWRLAPIFLLCKLAALYGFLHPSYARLK